LPSQSITKARADGSASLRHGAMHGAGRDSSPGQVMRGELTNEL
jgi:hypothetical protein